MVVRSCSALGLVAVAALACEPHIVDGDTPTSEGGSTSDGEGDSKDEDGASSASQDEASQTPEEPRCPDVADDGFRGVAFEGEDTWSIFHGYPASSCEEVTPTTPSGSYTHETLTIPSHWMAPGVYDPSAADVRDIFSWKFNWLSCAEDDCGGQGGERETTSFTVLRVSEDQFAGCAVASDEDGVELLKWRFVVDICPR